MARSESRAARILFGIRHSEKMSGIDAYEKFKVDFLRGKFISKFSKQFLKITTCRNIGNTERITNDLKDTAFFLIWSISIGSKRVNGVDIRRGIVVRFGKEINCKFNFLICVRINGIFDRFKKNLLRQILNKVKIGIVSARAIDNQSLKINIPNRGSRKQIAKFRFSIKTVNSKAMDKGI